MLDLLFRDWCGALERLNPECDDNEEVMGKEEFSCWSREWNRCWSQSKSHGRKPGMNADGVRWSLGTTHDAELGKDQGKTEHLVSKWNSTASLLSVQTIGHCWQDLQDALMWGSRKLQNTVISKRPISCIEGEDCQILPSVWKEMKIKRDTASVLG